MVLLLFNIPADRFGIHIVVGHCLVPLAVVHIGKTVRSLVNFAGLGIVNALVAEGGVALLLAHNVLTSVAAFPGGHKAVHGRIEVLADLLSKGNLFIACLIGGTDKAVGLLQGFEAIGQHTFPLDKGVLCGGNSNDVVSHIVAAVHRLELIAYHIAVAIRIPPDRLCT